MEITKHTDFREALMRAWVAGWHAGMKGEPTDDGKRETAERLAAQFKELDGQPTRCPCGSHQPIGQHQCWP